MDNANVTCGAAMGSSNVVKTPDRSTKLTAWHCCPGHCVLARLPRLTIVFVAVSTTFTEESHCELTKGIRRPRVKAEWKGLQKPGILAMTELWAVATTLTVPLTWLETYASEPSGLNVTQMGSTPVAIVPTTWFVAVAITDIVPSNWLVA